LAQIKKYNWLDKKMIVGCHKNMKLLDDKRLFFEVNIVNCKEDKFKFIHKDFGTITIGGRIDAFDDTTVYEFKCVDNISIDHKLQLILYSWLWKNSDLHSQHGNKNFKLLNIKTGELIQLTGDNYKITQVVELLFANKFVKKIVLKDDEFIKQTHKLEDKYINNIG
jgi:hypothetical protein